MAAKQEQGRRVVSLVGRAAALGASSAPAGYALARGVQQRGDAATVDAHGALTPAPSSALPAAALASLLGFCGALVYARVARAPRWSLLLRGGALTAAAALLLQTLGRP